MTKLPASLGVAISLLVVPSSFAVAQEHARVVGTIDCRADRLVTNRGFNVGMSGCGLNGWHMVAQRWELDAGWYVDSDNPGCDNRYGPDFVKVIARAIAAYYSYGTSEADGETSFENIFNQVDTYMGKQGGEIASAWRRLHNIQDQSRCHLLVVPVPVPPERVHLVSAIMHEGGRIGGSENACFQTPVNGGAPHQTSARCPVNWSAIEYLEIAPHERGSVVVAMAKNWSHDRKREPSLHVWYSDGGGLGAPGGTGPGTISPGTMRPGTMGPGEWYPSGLPKPETVRPPDRAPTTPPQRPEQEAIVTIRMFIPVEGDEPEGARFRLRVDGKLMIDRRDFTKDADRDLGTARPIEVQLGTGAHAFEVELTVPGEDAFKCSGRFSVLEAGDYTPSWGNLPAGPQCNIVPLDRERHER
jgi:hypothetical protein